MEQLNLYENELSGSIAELGNLTNLTYLRLILKRLIPAALGNLTNLRRLILYINDLSGSIPSSLGPRPDRPAFVRQRVKRLDSF